MHRTDDGDELDLEAVLTEDQVNQARFGQYLDGYLKKDDVVDPYVETLLRQSTPEATLTLLRESFEDLHLVLSEIAQLSRVSHATFVSIGRVLHREVRRNDLLAALLDKKFKPIHDRIQNPAVVAIIRKADPRDRKHVAKTFLEFFRLLRYLEYASPEGASDEDVLHRREGDVLPQLGESDVGLFSLSARACREPLPDFAGAVAKGRATAERNFLPFIPWMAARDELGTLPVAQPIESMGVNTPEELARAEAELAAREPS